MCTVCVFLIAVSHFLSESLPQGEEGGGDIIRIMRPFTNQKNVLRTFKAAAWASGVCERERGGSFSPIGSSHSTRTERKDFFTDSRRSKRRAREEQIVAAKNRHNVYISIKVNYLTHNTEH